MHCRSQAQASQGTRHNAPRVAVAPHHLLCGACSDPAPNLPPVGGARLVSTTLCNTATVSSPPTSGLVLVMSRCQPNHSSSPSPCNPCPFPRQVPSLAPRRDASTKATCAVTQGRKQGHAYAAGCHGGACSRLPEQVQGTGQLRDAVRPNGLATCLRGGGACSRVAAGHTGRGSWLTAVLGVGRQGRRASSTE